MCTLCGWWIQNIHLLTCFTAILPIRRFNHSRYWCEAILATTTWICLCLFWTRITHSAIFKMEPYSQLLLKLPTQSFRTHMFKSTIQKPKNLIDAKTVLLAIRAVKSMQIGEFKASPFTLFMCIVKQKKERISINRSNTHLREKWRSSTRRSWIGWLCKYHLIFCTFIIYLPFNKFSLSRSLSLFNVLEIDQFSTNLWVSSEDILFIFILLSWPYIYLYFIQLFTCANTWTSDMTWQCLQYV